MRKIEFPWWGIIGDHIVRVNVESNQYIYPEYDEKQKGGVLPVAKSNKIFRELRFKTVQGAIKELAKIRHQTEEEVLKEVQSNFPSMKIILKKRMSLKSFFSKFFSFFPKQFSLLHGK
ncbi:MAG: hypothetical protein WC499_02080 [Patescibacteria group bacterium]